MKKVLLPPICLLIGYSCQKQPVQPIATPAEHVDMQLLREYISYDMALQRKALWNKPITAFPTLKRFNQMISNFLANERNNLRERLSSIIPFPGDDGGCEDAEGNKIPCPPDTPGLGNPGSGDQGNASVSCTGSFTDYNTINTIAFTASLNPTQTSIITSSFAFGGIGGTWSPVGTISQQCYSGVITYEQYYQEQYNIVFGLTVTHLFILYGNIYNGACTVQGMQVVQQSPDTNH